ncbi:hypothetical protein [Burkholderia vietnamiensis]|uniref:hypothetical protein n=1 Tax=Burkholderia vietnamiensis TaxID=60552 RepID=UPI001B9445F1|nr:hypothetical protein [Burkholderia vietnamiensis]MBR8030838.1 hypothetical protein [Burkholderia vietnamiensis]
MKERPILFSGPMVRAILEGRKTQTRRVAKEFAGRDDLDAILGRFPNQRGCPHGEPGDRLWVRETHEVRRIGTELTIGGIPMRRYAGVAYKADDGRAEVDIDLNTFQELDAKESRGWTPSIHMPRWASRIALEITGVRAERLQSISESDAIAEGAVYTDFGIEPPKGSLSLDGGRTFHPIVRGTQRNGWHMGDATSHKQCLGSARYAFANLINRLHGGENWNLKGPGLWEANPWVWVVEFRRIDGPEKR